MKKLAILGLLALELAVSGCGHSSTTATPTTAAGGIWQATLVGGKGDAAAIDFITSFTVNGDNSLSISSQPFFFNVNPCFVSGATATGNLTITSGTNTAITGSFSFTVASGTPSGNTLTLTNGVVTGTLNGSTISGGSITGGWTLTGGAGNSDCIGTGSFTLKQS